LKCLTKFKNMCFYDQFLVGLSAENMQKRCLDENKQFRPSKSLIWKGMWSRNGP